MIKTNAESLGRKIAEVLGLAENDEVELLVDKLDGHRVLVRRMKK